MLQLSCHVRRVRRRRRRRLLPRGGARLVFGFHGGGGYSNFNRGYGRSVGGLSINIGNGGYGHYGGFSPVNRSFYGGGIPYYVARPAFVPVVPVYRGGFYGGGGHYGGYRGGGYGGGGYRNCGGGW